MTVTVPRKKPKHDPPAPCEHDFREVGTVTKKGVTYTVEACRKCHERRIK